MAKVHWHDRHVFSDTNTKLWQTWDTQLLLVNKAVQDAKDQAATLSAATGVKLGNIISINTQAQIPTQYPRFGVASMEAAPMGDTSTPIAFGTQNIATTVMIVWEIE